MVELSTVTTGLILTVVAGAVAVGECLPCIILLI